MKRMLLIVAVLSLLVSAKKPTRPWYAAPRSDLKITADRSDNTKGESVVIYGSGVGIWNNSVQIRIDAQRVNRILAAFDAAHFENLPSAKEGERLRRRAGIRAGEYSREVFDTWESDEETEGKKEKRKENALEKLVNSIFTIVMPVAKKGGPGAASLSGGLKAIASGQLAPETLTIILLVKPEIRQSEAGSGFLLHIADGFATSTPYGAQGQNPARIKLTDSQIRDIAGRLATVEPETLPANLYATNYEDLTITIFNRRKNVMARQFAAMTPTKFGEAQKRFDTLIAWLEEKRATLFPQSPSAQ